MVILEIQGVRSSTRSFQIDIEVKQTMVMKPEEIFNTCIFKKKGDSSGSQPISTVPPILPVHSIPLAIPETEEPIIMKEIGNEIQEQKESENIFIAPLEEEQEIENKEDENDLREIEFNLEELNPDDTVNLKERKEMYYQMYQEARQKAKVARDLALSAYLEARQIKNKYMLDDANDSSSDSEDSDVDPDEEDE